MQKQSLENQYMYYGIANGILWADFKNAFIDEKAARQCVKERIIISKGQSFPLLNDLTKIKSMSKEARAYFASAQGTAQGIAAALIVDSFLSRMIANLFIAFDRPQKPTKVFTDKKKALKWLEQFLRS